MIKLINNLRSRLTNTNLAQMSVGFLTVLGLYNYGLNIFLSILIGSLVGVGAHEFLRSDNQDFLLLTKKMNSFIEKLSTFFEQLRAVVNDVIEGLGRAFSEGRNSAYNLAGQAEDQVRQSAVEASNLVSRAEIFATTVAQRVSSTRDRAANMFSSLAETLRSTFRSSTNAMS